MVIHRRMGWTAQSASRAVAAAVACLALVASGCSSDDGLRSGDAASLAAESTAEVAIGDGDWTRYAGGDVIADGAKVRATNAEARLTFRGGTARLAPGAVATVSEDALTLDRGEVLVDSDGGLPVVNGDTRVTGNGVVRVSAGLSSRVAVYRGVASVTRPSQERDVPALRQLDLAPFRLADADPLRYREGDTWDQELVADAIAFDGEAARIARGIEVEFGSAPLGRAFYTEFTRPRAVPLLRASAPVIRGPRFGPPSDVLLTVFVADAATATASVREGIQAVTALRDAGARWGLIAVELDVRSQAVVAAIDTLDTEQLALADRESAPPATAGSGDGPLGSTGTSTGSTGAGPTDGTGTGTGAPAPLPTGGGEEDPSTGGGDDGGGGDGGGDPDPVPPPPEDTEETVEEVVSEVIEAIPGDEDDDDDGSGGPDLPDVPPVP